MRRCVVHLHGKGGNGGPSTTIDGIVHLRPAGNATGWKGRQWLYFPDSGYEVVRSIVTNAVSDAGCGKILVHGFSNGAAAAAKLFCRGESFGSRTVGYVLDDPVPDHGADHCTPAPGVKVRLYSTGALAVATDGWFCASGDWTCEGGTTVGIANYAKSLNTEVQRSVNTTHKEYESPPEYTTWW
jgi:hypothetical protein